MEESGICTSWLPATKAYFGAAAALFAVVCCSAVPNEPTNVDRIGSAVRVDGGAESSGWRAWTYRTRSGDVCVEVAGTAGGGYRCDQGIEALGAPGLIRTASGTFIVGGTYAIDAATAEVDDASGSRSTASLVAADPIAAGLRVYVLEVQEAAPPMLIKFFDSAEREIESVPVGG